jgi:spore coat polysaccharide biosynthesis protein SpsF
VSDRPPATVTSPAGAGASAPRVVAIIQARMGSQRLPGKVLAPIEGRSLLAWTVAGFRAVATIDEVVVATSVEPGDDVLADAARALGPVHRGSALDVLARVAEAARLQGADVVVRGTADNPFPDPGLIAAQVALCIEGDLDYVGGSGHPPGLAAEVLSAASLEAAAREARDPAEREHVTPFVHQRPDRFRLGLLPAGEPPAAPVPARRGRYTVDTEADLAFVRAIAARLAHPPPVGAAELDAILAAEPGLAALNDGVRQRSWKEVAE